MSWQNLQQIEEIRQQYLGYLIDSSLIQVDRNYEKELSRWVIIAWFILSNRTVLVLDITRIVTNLALSRFHLNWTRTILPERAQ
jgi:hypothetical protein